MSNVLDFQPNWASAPGETILEILQQKELSKTEFQKSIGLNSATLQNLLKGSLRIDFGIAEKLSKTLGASIDFWLSRDDNYIQSLGYIKTLRQKDWINTLPLSDMAKLGWLSVPTKIEEKLKACLDYFNVGSVEEWDKQYSERIESALFRLSSTIIPNYASIASWLRQGEIQASKIKVDEWNPQSFKKSLLEIKSLTRIKETSKFLPKLQKICSNCGVAVAIVKSPKGCNASGASLFSKDNKPIIVLSFRYLTDDHFWFTFFHEAGHLLLHTDQTIFIDNMESHTDHTLTQKEVEANKFAENYFIPVEFSEEFKTLSCDPKNIIKFSQKVGVSPGIIVGQLQFKGILGYNSMNKLKRRFNWDEIYKSIP